MQAKLKTSGVLLALTVPLLSTANAQQLDESEMDDSLDLVSLMETDLSAFLNAEVTVASGSSSTLRDTPGIVSVITSQDIKDMGARDLIDVLNTVPGMSFGVDVAGVVGLGVRGIWAHEGKVLLIIDGQEMNEDSYSTLQFGGHYPVADIERVEIIRGPGSAIYGGYAELAVIRITTLSGAKRNGARAQFTLGALSGRTLGRATLDLAVGQSLLNDDLEVSVSANMGQVARSNQNFTDIYGTSESLDGNSDIRPAFVNLGVRYKAANFRLIYDDYSFDHVDGYDAVTPRFEESFRSILMGADYRAELGGGFAVTPKLSYKRQNPWKATEEGTVDEYLFYNVRTEKSLAGLSASYTSKDLELLTGAEVSQVKGIEEDVEAYREAFDAEGQFVNDAGESVPNISYTNVAVFAQAMYRSPIANITIGSRYENHNAYGSSFVPRLALTKVVDAFHVKLLASRAFRAPGLMNISAYGGEEDSIAPERTTVYELEAGYRITDSIFAVGNLFDTTIKQPIVYYYDDVTELEGYDNFDKTGSRGVEGEVRAHFDRGMVSATYAHYRAKDNEVDSYQVPGRGNALLGLARNKVTLRSRIKVVDGLHFNPSVIYQGKRYAFSSLDDDGVEKLETLPAATMVNLIARYEGLVEGLSVMGGVFNAANVNLSYAQPYNSYHAPLPAQQREYVARVNYQYSF